MLVGGVGWFFVLVNLVLVRFWARRTARVALGLAFAGFGAVAWDMSVAFACDLSDRKGSWLGASLVKDRPAGDGDRVQERLCEC